MEVEGHPGLIKTINDDEEVEDFSEESDVEEDVSCANINFSFTTYLDMSFPYYYPSTLLKYIIVVPLLLFYIKDYKQLL